MHSGCTLSPEIISVIIDRFSPRPELLTGRPVRFPLRHCRAVARIDSERRPTRVVDIELVDLGFSGVGFEAREPIPRDTVLTIELQVPGLPTQIWICRVVSVHSFDGASHRMGARIEAAGTV